MLADASSSMRNIPDSVKSDVIGLNEDFGAYFIVAGITQMATKAIISLGSGMSSTVATGGTEVIEGAVSAGARTEAQNLAEQLTLKEAQSGAGRQIMQGSIKDPKFPADTWAKMQHTHTTPEGQNIVIHYWQRLVDGLRTGFKFKD